MAEKQEIVNVSYFIFVILLEVGKLEYNYAKFSQQGAWTRSRDS